MGWKGIEPLPITKINFFTENPNYHSSTNPGFCYGYFFKLKKHNNKTTNKTMKRNRGD